MRTVEPPTPTPTPPPSEPPHEPAHEPAQEPAQWSELLADAPDRVATLARRLRTAALAALPDLTERVYPGWQGLGLRHPAAGLLATIFLRADDVVVYFERGARLPDPDRLFTGAERLRRTRTIVFDPDTGRPGTDAFVTYLDLAVEHGRPRR